MLLQTFKSVPFPENARKCIEFSKNMESDLIPEEKRELNLPMIETEFGMVYRSAYASGLVLVAAYRCVEVTTFIFFIKKEIRIQISELSSWNGSICSDILFESVLSLPKSEFDLMWSLKASARESSSVRAIADLKQAGECTSL